MLRVRPKWTRANGEQRCRQSGIRDQRNQRNGFQKETRVLIYASHAYPAQSQLQLVRRSLSLTLFLSFPVSKDTTYAHGDMPTHDIVDTQGRLAPLGSSRESGANP